MSFVFGRLPLLAYCVAKSAPENLVVSLLGRHWEDAKRKILLSRSELHVRILCSGLLGSPAPRDVGLSYQEQGHWGLNYGVPQN